MKTMFIINACRPSRKSSKNASSGRNVGRHLLCRGVKAECVVPQILMYVFQLKRAHLLNTPLLP